MTSYLVLYRTMGAKLFGHGENARGLRPSWFGVLPHEIAALNAAAQERAARRRQAVSPPTEEHVLGAPQAAR
jgi:hypothetical protein